ncbi:MAG TPA: malate dehydrogenase [Sedimenticola sp.]|nr:malate dehydrogenase [Sedimenticola sp.]
MSGRNKIALIGAGQIGGILALIATQKELGDLVLVDLPALESKVRGKVLDLLALRPHDGYDVELAASGEFAAIAGADLVIVTAGVPRRPGMSREDLLETNLGIIREVARQVARHAPDAFVILTTNPLDAMIYAFHQASGLPGRQLVGMAGALDSGRFRTFIAMETGLSVQDVSALVIGGHGPSMIPLTRTATVGGVPIDALLTEEQIAAIVRRTQGAGTEIVELLGNGSAFYSPAAAVMEMAEACLKDKKRVIPAAALCQGEYGVDGWFIGVPCVIGAGGVERVLEFPLTPEERSRFEATLEAVKRTVAKTGPR